MTRTAGFEDTIAALATPPGRGAIALIRMSGPRAVEILDRIVLEAHRGGWRDRRQHLTRLAHPDTGRPIDRGLVTVFFGPGSYTGEDVVEISTHGGMLTPQLVLDALHAAGARGALPGEFTRRALLNGKMDLLQAEAVADLIDGRSPAMHDAALHQIERGLSRRIEDLRTAILQLEALVSYSIDFPDEDEPPAPPERIRTVGVGVLERLFALLDTVPQGRMLREGALIVFGGRPNSGKSSLFNALLGLERSIVTEVPGTTRDAVEADALLEGFPFRLVDTAGLRSTEDRVEALGIEVARKYLAAADILLYCAPAREPVGNEEIAFLTESGARQTVLARTKSDLLSGAEVGVGDVSSHTALEGHGGPFVAPAVPNVLGPVDVSVVTGAGLGKLRGEIVGAAFAGMGGGAAGAGTIITSERQRRALEGAAAEVRSFIGALDADVEMVVAAVHLGAAVTALEDLIGVVTTDDVLDVLFARFCVGK